MLPNDFKLSDLTNEELSRVVKESTRLQKKRKIEELIRTLNEYRETWVGRCFKSTRSRVDELVIYYKVINEHANSENCVGVLTFFAQPRFEFIRHSSFKPISYDDWIEGTYNLFSFELESVPILALARFEEISEEEFNAAFDAHCEALKEMEFEIKNII